MDDVTCTPEEWAITSSVTWPLVQCLTHNESFWLTIVAGAGVISTTSVVMFFGLVLRNILRAPRGLRIVQKPMDVYMLCLFLGELLHGISATLVMNWAYKGKVQSGSVCDIQGFLGAIGNLVVALCTLVIAVHTFISIWWHKKMDSLTTPYLISTTLWILAVVYATSFFATHRNPLYPYYRPRRGWCMEDPSKFTGFVLRLVAEWAALSSSLILHSMLLWRIVTSIDNSENSLAQAYNPEINVRRICYTLFIYAFTYTMLFLPVSALTFFNIDSTLEGLLFAAVGIYSLSGFVNVCLFFLTRFGLLLFDSAPRMRRRNIKRTACEEGRLPDVDGIDLGSWMDKSGE